MYTKSLIQQQRETVEVLSEFKNRINQLNEKYDIEEAVFGLHNRVAKEVMSGYMELSKKYENISEALKSIDSERQGIYIKNSSEVWIGEIKNSTVECKSDEILDISTLKKITF